MIRAILFDCWGTILHAPRLMTREAAIEAFHRTLIELGYEADFKLFRETYLREAERQHREADRDYRELDYVERLRRVLEAIGLEGDTGKIAEEIWKRYLDEWPRQSRLDPEAPGLLRRLRASYRLALVTNFPDLPTAHRVFDTLNLWEYFDAVVVSAEVGYRKPSPIIFQEALEQLKVKPQEAVMVGDTLEADIEGAKSLGIKTILIDPERARRGEKPEGADAIIKSLRELEKALENLVG
ncbi:HAD family hydrolase [Candidatus Bathyarchaeota archaeon]|nr:HAD family hydrolase [Candidatus Bathyarchaeota archaeon]